MSEVEEKTAVEEESQELEAGATSSESRSETEASSADKGKEGAKPEQKEEDKDKFPGSGNPAAWSRIKNERDSAKSEAADAKAKVEALESLGVTDEESVNRLIERAQMAEELEAQLEEPSGFISLMERVANEHPQVYQTFGTSLVNAWLEDQAAQYRKAGKENEAKFFEANRIGKASTADQDDGKRDGLREREAKFMEERLTDFDQRVHEDIRDLIEKDVNQLAGEVQFASDRQKENFFSDVRSEIASALDKQATYKMELNERRHPKHGLDASHRKNVREFIAGRMKSGGILAKAVATVLKDYGISGERKKQPERNEVLGGGGGTPPSDDRATLKAQIEKDYKEGKITMDERRKRMWQLPPSA